jgi:hypothetical protein
VKCIQIVDGALNWTCSIFAAIDEELALLFPEPEEEIQFAGDLAQLPAR